jgi:hypothetical protein
MLFGETAIPLFFNFGVFAILTIAMILAITCKEIE